MEDEGISDCEESETSFMEEVNDTYLPPLTSERGKNHRRSYTPPAPHSGHYVRSKGWTCETCEICESNIREELYEVVVTFSKLQQSLGQQLKDMSDLMKYISESLTRRIDAENYMTHDRIAKLEKRLGLEWKEQKEQVDIDKTEPLILPEPKTPNTSSLGRKTPVQDGNKSGTIYSKVVKAQLDRPVVKKKTKSKLLSKTSLTASSKTLPKSRSHSRGTSASFRS